MRKDNVRVAIWGLGAMGKGMADVLERRQGIEITGACDLNPDYVGKGIYDVLGKDAKGRENVIIGKDIDEVMTNAKADVLLMATDSFTVGAAKKIKQVAKYGANIISTAEEMAYPKAGEPELTAEMDKIAKENNITILGTGINPGLMMDLLVVCLSGACTDIQTIKAERVNSLSPFGKAVMEEQGVGITVAEFDKGVAEGTLAGHVGFKESIFMIDEALGLGLNGFDQQMKSIVTDVDRTSPYGFAAKGNVAGVNMTGQGTKNGKVIVDMIHPQQIEPEQVGVNTGDYITIKGTPEVNMSIKPEIDGGIGTIAMCVNMIPQVINARAGLKTMIDLPVPRAIVGDYREMIEE